MSKSYKRRQIQAFFDPYFEEVRGGVEPWWMAHWKAHAEFLLSVIELLFLSLMVEVLCDDAAAAACYLLSLLRVTYLLSPPGLRVRSPLSC